MSNLIPVDAKRFQEADDVMTLYAKGYKPLEIAKKLKISRAVVDDHVEEWRTSVIGSSFVRDRVAELLAQMDDHFSSLIKELHYTVDAIATGTQDPALMAQRTAAIKAISDVTGKRIDALQKAGLLDAADLGDEMADTERKVTIMMNILKEVTAKCPTCGPEIKRRSVEVDGRSHGDVQTVIIDGEVVE